MRAVLIPTVRETIVPLDAPLFPATPLDGEPSPCPTERAFLSERGTRPPPGQVDVEFLRERLERDRRVGPPASIPLDSSLATTGSSPLSSIRTDCPR